MRSEVNWLMVPVVALLSVSAFFVYFILARKHHIIDKPNQRSSHTAPTIRGGGAVFVFILLISFFISSFSSPWFYVGCLLVGMISFADDIRAQSASFRLSVQLMTFLFLAMQVGLSREHPLIVAIVLIVGIGTINAFNFMDGINGITGIYALVNFASFLWLNAKVIEFTDSNLIVAMIVAVLVFLYFNFRKRAVCFAGDVGSVTLAYVQVYFCLQLILHTGNYSWVLFFVVFGADSVSTIVYRLRNKENIFAPHRSHLYQYLSNELGFSHRGVSLLYGMIQLAINIFLMVNFYEMSLAVPLAVLLVTGIVTVALREWVLRKIGKDGIILRLRSNEK